MIAIITGSTRFILGVTKMSQADFSVKVKGQTKRYTQMNKITGADRDTHNTFTDFIQTSDLSLKLGRLK